MDSVSGHPTSELGPQSPIIRPPKETTHAPHLFTNAYIVVGSVCGAVSLLHLLIFLRRREENIQFSTAAGGPEINLRWSHYLRKLVEGESFPQGAHARVVPKALHCLLALITL